MNHVMESGKLFQQSIILLISEDDKLCDVIETPIEKEAIRAAAAFSFNPMIEYLSAASIMLL